MPFGAIAGLIGPVIGGITSLTAGSNSSSAANSAIALQQQQYQDAVKNLAPFLGLGTNAAEVLAGLFGISPTGGSLGGAFGSPISATVGAPPSPNNPGANFQASPGYQYQLGQQQNAIQNSAAGKTGAVSGNMMRALQGNAQGLAGQDYWNWYNAINQNYNTRYQDVANNRNQIIQVLAGLGSAGQNAAVTQGGFGQNYASNAGALGLYGANAQNAGLIGAGNAVSNAFSSPSFGNSLNTLFGGGGQQQYAGIPASMTGDFQDLVGISGGGY